jgi:enoyl-CoA hydratase/carnithine racemase
MSETAYILRTQSDGVSTLTLNRPESRNALSLNMLDALELELRVAALDSSVRVLVIAGAGPAFCAGHDLKEMRGVKYHCDYSEKLFAACSRVMQAIIALPKPVIAQVHGVASAAGCQLVASCDLAVAADTARFATPGVNIGLFCSTPMVALSRNVGHKAALAMLLTGELIDAAAATRIGLINESCPEAELASRTMQLAQKIAGKSAQTLAIGKQAFYRQAEMPLAQAYDYTARIMVANLQEHDAQEGIGAFLDKRVPVWSAKRSASAA